MKSYYPPFLLLVLLIISSCGNEKKTSSVKPLQKANYITELEVPKDVRAIADLLAHDLDSSIIQVSDAEVSGVLELQVMRGDSSSVFKYYLLPDTLSYAGYTKFTQYSLIRSCLVDENTYKNLLFKHYYFTPGCGSVSEDDKRIVHQFYSLLNKLGAKETKADFILRKPAQR